MVATAAAMAAQKRKKELREKKLIEKAEQREKAIEAWFELYDTSKTGKMSREEMRALLTAVKRDALKEPGGSGNRSSKEEISASVAVSEELLDEVFLYADVSQDGQIEKQHLLAAIKKYKCLLLEREGLKELFAKHDRDKSGDLDESQLLTLLQEIAPAPHKHADEGDAQFIMARCDVTRSGTITWAELKPAIATWMEVSADVKPEKEGSSSCVLL